MNLRLTSLVSAAAVAVVLAAGPAFSQAADMAQLRTEIADELVMINYTLEGGVESLTDEQVMELKQVLGDCDCNAAEKAAAIDAALAD
jgi:hypothetical protein